MVGPAIRHLSGTISECPAAGVSEFVGDSLPHLLLPLDLVCQVVVVLADPEITGDILGDAMLLGLDVPIYKFQF